MFFIRKFPPDWYGAFCVECSLPFTEEEWDSRCSYLWDPERDVHMECCPTCNDVDGDIDVPLEFWDSEEWNFS